MNGSRFYRLLMGVVILLLASCVPPPTPKPVSCVDFSGYADNTPLAAIPTIPNVYPNGFSFSGAPSPFINVNGNVVGLQFADGLEISLPNPASSVKLDVASFSQPLGLTAIDINGVAVANANVPNDHAVDNIALPGQGIAKIMVKGGGGEGVLVKICS